MTPPDEAWLARCRDRMARIDKLPRSVQDVVNEYGLSVVDALMQAGVVKARVMRHLIRVIREDANAYANGRSVEARRMSGEFRPAGGSGRRK